MTETLQHHEQADNIIYPEIIKGNEKVITTEIQKYYSSPDFFKENSPEIIAANIMGIVE